MQHFFMNVQGAKIIVHRHRDSSKHLGKLEFLMLAMNFELFIPCKELQTLHSLISCLMSGTAVI